MCLCQKLRNLFCENTNEIQIYTCVAWRDELPNLVLVCTFLVVRLNSYQHFLDQPFKFYDIDIPKIEYIANPNSWNVIPLNNVNACWINIECVPANWITYKEDIGSYTKIISSFNSYGDIAEFMEDTVNSGYENAP